MGLPATASDGWCMGLAWSGVLAPLSPRPAAVTAPTTLPIQPSASLGALGRSARAWAVLLPGAAGLSPSPAVAAGRPLTSATLFRLVTSLARVPASAASWKSGCFVLM
uniref:Putative secreted protein n=1 Tax=Ixodes ricinus TaxID=34613 RepID=A0A6B0UHU3_IXORI